MLAIVVKYEQEKGQSKTYLVTYAIKFYILTRGSYNVGRTCYCGMEQLADGQHRMENNRKYKTAIN